MQIIQDIWIISHSGTVLFNRVYDDKIQNQLFGALMSALNSFAENLAEGGLSNFELSNKRFVIIKTKSYMFVANASKKVKEKKINEQLEKVVGKFLEKFPDSWFDNWDCDPNVFDCFEKEIEESLESPVEQFWTGF